MSKFEIHNHKQDSIIFLLVYFYFSIVVKFILALR